MGKQYINDFKVCATCKHWEGSREFFGNLVREIEEGSSGKCQRTHATMRENHNCPNWEKK